jgi:heme/copper-type cytochrome/quinol oxidase subunit 2
MEGDNAQEDKEMKDRIIKTEEKAVRNARLLVITAILSCAVAVSTAIYFVAKKNDHDTFELEVSNNRHIDCWSIVIATIYVLTVIPTPYLMTHL